MPHVGEEAFVITTMNDKVAIRRPDASAPQRDGQRHKGGAAALLELSHRDGLEPFLRFLIAPHQRVLLIVPAPVDNSGMCDPNRRIRINHPAPDIDVTDLSLSLAGGDKPFDYIVVGDALASCPNIGSFLHRIRQLCEPHTRIVVSSGEGVQAALWRRVRAPRIDGVDQSRNLLTGAGTSSIMASCGFERIGSRRSPRGGGNGFAIYRPIPQANCGGDDSLTICLTCRNEKDNIEPIVQAIPRVTGRQEILIVEGHSDDGTRAEIERVMACHAEKNIRLISQPGIGQGDAIREGFSQASGRFIILLEADMTSPPDDIIPVYNSLRAGFGEFICGTRFVYPMAKESMPLLNRFGNRFFARYFCWLLGQHVSDVLCGIKGISKAHFDQIAARWGQWGIDDPFGDFELLFGANQIGLKVSEVPVHYRPRSFGQTKTRPFRHGAILFRLAARAFLMFRR
jgi:hypothetical protein